MQTEPVNNPSKAGQLATEKEFFGDYKRFAVAAVHTRFTNVSWFVWDAEQIDEVTGFALVVRQEESKDSAISGLERLS